MMIKNIVFDMGNVLARFDAAEFCAARVEDKDDRALVCREVFNSVFWAMLDRGVITNEAAVSAMCKNLPARLHADADWLVNHWYDHFTADAAMERFIAALREKVSGIYLLSNAGFDFYKFKPKIAALKYFDGLLVSCDVHLLKPDRAIFDALLSKFSLASEECFFVDDMSVNVEAALNRGFSGMVYRGEIDGLKDALRDAGVV
jgi:putative hydrolase of the HAD superfamily